MEKKNNGDYCIFIFIINLLTLKYTWLIYIKSTCSFALVGADENDGMLNLKYVFALIKLLKKNTYFSTILHSLIIR